MILTDTGYWLALANRRDTYHNQAIEVTQSIQSELVITWPVMTEVCHLLNSRLDRSAPVKFIHQVEQFTTIFELETSHLTRIKGLMQKYQDLPMDLADASLVITAEELNISDILSTDRRDFQTYRWKNHKPFHNLLFPDDF